MIPYRDDNPTQRAPVVVIVLIAINLAVFLWELLLPPDQRQLLLYRYGVVPAAIFTGAKGVRLGPGEVVPLLQPPWLAIFTSMFLHGGFAHVAGNMLYLWIFGDNIEDLLGPVRFLLFYFICGAAAAGLQMLLSVRSSTPMVGASGAIAGVLGAYYVSFPRAHVRTIVLFFFITVVTLPASLVLGLWFLLQLWGGTQSLVPGAGGGVAFFAHIGGFIAGYLLIKAFTPKSRRRAVRWYDQ